MLISLDLKNLSKKFGIENFETEIIVSDFLKISKEKLLSKKFEISNENFLKLKKLLEKKARKIPTAYILQKKEFFGKTFFVNNHTLIPRPESERLIEIFSQEFLKFQKFITENQIEKNKNFIIFDVGTGSGNISIIIKNLFPELKVFGIEKSKFAIKVAEKNRKNQKQNLKFIHSDIFSNKKIQKIFPDFIIANLPYVPKKEFFSLEKNIYFEPKTSILGGKDGLKFIKKLLVEIKKFDFQKNLKGIFLEIDPSHSKFLQKEGFQIIKFYDGLDRFAIKIFNKF